MAEVATGLTQVSSYLVYYKWIKGELERRPIYDCRCDERRKAKAKGSTRLTYNGLFGGLKHLKIETRLIDEMFASVRVKTYI